MVGHLPDVVVRSARKDDSGDIAALLRISSDGLAASIGVCMDDGPGRSRLYRRLDFRSANRRPLVPYSSLKHQSGDAILMVRVRN